ncbi:DNA ligase 1-like [Lolium rigidum]|uniref:DNA ligase 1-like n=1 Tax=Lolium rigidum TaxID=89674 RepID=UPI001F5CA192|nr:DNA ligase 1-like [Lolium rigidum]
MARKRKRRGDAAATEAPVEVAQQEAPAAAADSAAAAKTGRPRGGDAAAEQEASAAVHAPGPADSGKETTDGEGKKPKRRKKKKKNNMQHPSPSAVSDDNAVELDKSRTDCKDVPGDDETIRSPRNEEDPGFSAEQDIPERKKPRRKKRKNNKQEQSPSAVTDGDTIVVGTSGNDCTHGKGVPGVADVSMSSRNGEDQDCPEVNIGEKGAPERKKPKRRQKKKNMQQPSPSAFSNGNAVELDKSRTDCKDVEDVPGDDETIRSPRNEEDPGFSAERDIPERKKPRRKKWKNNKQEQSPSAVTDGDAIVVGTSGNDCTHGNGVPRVADVTMSSGNGEDQDCPEVNIAEKETPGRKKPKLKKRKENKERSTATVSDDGAVLLHKSENDCLDGDDASGDAQVSVSTTNVEDPYCPEVNIAEKGTNERKKPKPKKRKEIKERSTATVSDDGAVLLHKSENDCIDGDDASGDAQVSVSTTNVEDPYCPEVNIAEKGTNERKKPKPKKRKNKKEGSSSVILDAGAVVADESRNSCKDGDCAPRDIEASISPQMERIQCVLR